MQILESALDPARKGYSLIGEGMFARVWAVDDETILKMVRQSDGTRNWLEFCHHLWKSGLPLMKGMPEVYAIGDMHREGSPSHQYRPYFCLMKRYACTLRESGGSWPTPSQVYDNFGTAFDAFAKWMVERGALPALREDLGPKPRPASQEEVDLWHSSGYDPVLCWFRRQVETDLHGGNVMLDEDGQWIATDPSCSAYHDIYRTPDFDLELTHA